MNKFLNLIREKIHYIIVLFSTIFNFLIIEPAKGEYKNVFGNFQEKEFFDIFSNSSFKLLVIKIQKIYLFTKFRQPSLSFLFEDFNTRKVEIKRSLVAKVIVVQGKLPNQKNEEINM